MGTHAECAGTLIQNVNFVQGAWSTNLAVWRSLTTKQKEDVAKNGALDVLLGDLPLGATWQEKLNRMNVLYEHSGLTLSEQEALSYFTASLSKESVAAYIACIGKTQALTVWMEDVSPNGGLIGVRWQPQGSNPNPERLKIGTVIGGKVHHGNVDKVPVGDPPTYLIFERTRGQDFRAIIHVGEFNAPISLRWLPEVLITYEKKERFDELFVQAGDNDGNTQSVIKDTKATTGWNIDITSISFSEPEWTVRQCPGVRYEGTGAKLIGTPDSKKFAWSASVTPSGGHCAMHAKFRVKYDEFRPIVQMKSDTVEGGFATSVALPV